MAISKSDQPVAPDSAISSMPFGYVLGYVDYYHEPYHDGYSDPYHDGYTGDRVPVEAGFCLFALVRALAGRGHAQKPRVTPPRFATEVCRPPPGWAELGLRTKECRGKLRAPDPAGR